MTRLKDFRTNKLTFRSESERPVKDIVVLREPSLVDEFFCEDCISSDGRPCVRVSDPLYLLFDEVRLSQLGDGAIKMWLDSLQPSSDPLSELRSKCTDEQLISMIKSRHLQAPSEIKAWAEYMDNNMELFNQELEMLQQPLEHVADPVPKSE